MAKTVDRQIVNGETYLIKDSAARESISDEVIEREAAVSAEATAREAEVSELKSALSDRELLGEDATKIDGLEINAFITNDGSVIGVNGWNLTGYIEKGDYALIEYNGAVNSAIIVQIYDSTKTVLEQHKRDVYEASSGKLEVVLPSEGDFYRICYEVENTSLLVCCNSLPSDISNRFNQQYDAFIKMNNEKKHLYLNASSFSKTYFNVDGAFRSSSGMTAWAGHQKYLHVGNAEELVFYHSYSTPIELNLYKYNKDKVGIALVQIDVAPNTFYYHKIETGTYFYAVSLCDKSSQDISLNDVDPKVWLIEYNCLASNEDSLMPIIPTFSFTDYATVGEKGEEYDDLATAYNSMSRKGVIIISPGTYDTGEHGFAPSDLYMIGSASELVRLENEVAAYPYAAAEIKGEGYIQGVSFVSKNSDYTTSAYSVHIESNLCQDKTVYFKDCIFEAQWNSAFGVGLRKGMHLVFENCRFVNIWECGINGHQPSEYDKSGALFFHPSIDSENYGKQHITCINCTFESKGAGALRMETIDGNLLIATFIGCNFTSEFYGDMNAVDIIGGAEHGYLCGQSIKLGKASHGNNVPLLNAENY